MGVGVRERGEKTEKVEVIATCGDWPLLGTLENIQRGGLIKSAPVSTTARIPLEVSHQSFARVIPA